jgi:chromosomal replication initiator protein
MADPANQLQADPQLTWEMITARLQAELPRQSYLTWFKPIEALAFDGSILTLKIPSQFYFDWIESHYTNYLKRAVVDALGAEIQLAYEIKSNGKVPSSIEEPEQPRIITPAEPRNDTFEHHLNPRYRFDNFIEGDCNRFARAAAIAIANEPGKTSFNPLMIYGGSGLGKTHLLQAIGNSILEKNTAKKVVYVTSEQFTADFVKGIQSGKSDSFNRLYRSVDVLLLDDVQFFMAKGKTQEEFFHTFNHLHHAGKQLVFSSDHPPRSLQGFDERLVSRLQWGLVSEITMPEYETRMAILKRRAEEEKVILSDEIAHYLAIHVTDNIRSLQGALIHMLAQASLMGRKMDIDLAREVLRNLVTRTERILSVERILDIVAEEYAIPSDLLRSKTRKKEVAEARQIAMFLTTEFTRLTLKAIGLHFGGRDHATVIHARETINERNKSDNSFAEKIEQLRRKIELASL